MEGGAANGTRYAPPMAISEEHSEPQLDRLLCEMPVGMFVCRWEESRQDFVLVQANPAADRIVRIELSAQLGQNLQDIFPGVRGTGQVERYRQVAAGGQAITAVRELPRGEDEVGHFEVTVFHSGPGEVGVLLVDVSERIRHERARETALRRLQESELFLDSIVEAIPIAVMVKEAPELRYRWVNHTAERLFGIPRAEFVGRTDAELFSEEVGHMFGQASRRALRLGIRVHTEDVVPTQNGSLHLSSTRVPHRDPATGEVRNVLCLMEDVTESHLLQQVRRSNRQLEEFAHVVSHDLRAPLRHLCGFAEMLPRQLGGDLTDDARQSLEMIEHASGRMSALVNDLLEYARLGRVDQAPTEVDLDDVLQQCFEAVAHGAEVAPRLECEGLPTLLGHEGWLVRLFQNLLENSVKYARPGRAAHIAVRGHREADTVTVEVRDDGVGIDPRFHDRIFDMFRRVHGPPEPGSTGAGLAICRKVTELHHGSISVSSELGRGATFTVVLRDLHSHGSHGVS